MTNLNLLNITALGSDGDGFAVSGEKKIFIPGSVPGDTICLSEEGNTEIITPSPHRIAPLCPVFGKCGGCHLQHIGPFLYNQFKKDQITRPLDAHKVPYEHISDPIIPGPHQRRRVILKAKALSKGKILLGYNHRQSHQIADTDICPLVTSSIQKFWPGLRSFMESFLHTGQKADIAITDTLAGLDVDIQPSWSMKPDLHLKEKLVNFGQESRLARLSLGGDIIAVWSLPRVSLGGVHVETNPRGFLQASQAADEIFEMLVHKHLPVSTDKLVIADLFSGRGTLTFPLSRHGTVDAFEMDEEALQAMGKATASIPGIPIRMYRRNLFQRPLTPAELVKYNLVCMDPPRSGAHEQIKMLSRSNVPVIFYFSCNPQSLARDGAILNAANYKLREIVPIDQFHWSTHAEAFALFIKS